MGTYRPLMAIPMTMVLDHSGNPLSAPFPKSSRQAQSLALRPSYVLTRSSSYRPPLRRSFSLPIGPRPSASPRDPSSCPAYATAFQQLRIVAVKYNGQDNDSVIYPRFGPPPVRLFPTTVEVVVAPPARAFRDHSTPSSVRHV